MRRRGSAAGARSLVAMASVIALLIGCDSVSAPNPNAHVGTYAVVSVNGEPLPYVALVVNGVTTRVMAGRVTLNANGTASDSYTYRYSDGSRELDETTTDLGTYTRNGREITVTWSGGGFPEVFDYEGDNLVLTEGSYVLRYRRVS